MEERAKVLDMLAAGKLNVDQATQLLEALGSGQPTRQPEPAPQAVSKPVLAGEDGPRRGRPRMRLDDLAGMRSVGVTAEYIRTMREIGVTIDNPDEYIGMVACGVTPEYVMALRDAGISNLDAGELTGMAAMGITAEQIAELRNAGLDDLDAGELIGMISSGVTPEYIAEMVALGVVEISPEVLAALKLEGSNQAVVGATINLAL